MKPCECGCGTEIPVRDKQGRLRRFLFGHQPRGQNQKQNTIQDVLLRLVICEPKALETGCWEWPSGKFSDGYGQVHLDGKTRKVHRVVYEHFQGPVPEGLQLHHQCNNKACANYEHLVALDARSHLHQGNTVNAANAAKTHCIRGHEFVEENTYRSQGHRKCRQCAKEKAR